MIKDAPCGERKRDHFMRTPGVRRVVLSKTLSRKVGTVVVKVTMDLDDLNTMWDAMLVEINRKIRGSGV